LRRSTRTHPAPQATLTALARGQPRFAKSVFLPISCRKEPRPRLSPSASAVRRFRLLGKWPPHRRRAHPEEKNVRCQQPTSGSARRPAPGLRRTRGGDTDFNQEQELHAYRHMLLIRRFEEKAGQLYGMGLIGGFCPLYIGQEAVVIGLQMAIKGGDAVITGYRDHGHMLACGMDPKGVMAELTGRRGGYS